MTDRMTAADKEQFARINRIHAVYTRRNGLLCASLVHPEHARRNRLWNVSFMGLGVVFTRARSAPDALRQAMAMVPAYLLMELAQEPLTHLPDGYPHVSVTDAPLDPDCPEPDGRWVERFVPEPDAYQAIEEYDTLTDAHYGRAA